MRRNSLRCALAVGALVVSTAALLGAGPPKAKPKPNTNGNGNGKAKVKVAAQATKADETLGNLAEVSGSDVRVEGVGLVVGLDNTGFDPPPSGDRQRLLDEMRKARVPGAERILASGKVAMVMVRGHIPAGLTPKDKIDVDVELPPGSGTADTSLAGGFLIQTRLAEVGFAGGQERQGQVLATAYGPVMTGTDANRDDRNAGRILGGGHARNEVPYLLLIDEKRQNIRTASQIESVVKQRFHRREGVDEKGAATAKSDKYLLLKVPKVYHQNQPRFFQVLKLLPMVDTPELRAERLAKWGQELLSPKTAGVAALRLEGLDKGAAEALKGGLAVEDSRVRFFAAEALAYLDDPAGVDVLAETAANLPEFRAHALAAMAAMDHPAASLRLRKLLNEADPGVRYGAFNALRTLDEHDPFLGQVRVLAEEPTPEPLDSMALAIEAPPRKRRPKQEDPFNLYLVDCEGPPLVHVARASRREVVIFGKTQKLITPVVLGGSGSILINAAEGDDRVQISRVESIVPGDAGPRVSSSLSLAEVVRETAQLGATYPEILAILQTAERQGNLPGPLKGDGPPAASMEYLRAQLDAADPKTAKKDTAVGRANFQEKGDKSKARGPSVLKRLFRPRG